jgi:Ca2+-binding RTX toxin-like protein
MKKGTRRVGLLLASMMMMLVVVGGVAWAATWVGTNGPDNVDGTPAADRLNAKGGNDTVDGRGGADSIWGGDGRDLLVDGLLGDTSTDYLYGGWGNDTINTNNNPNHLDWVKCGPGYDKLVADPNDRFLGNPNACEDVRVY